jgi:hypothetical protein
VPNFQALHKYVNGKFYDPTYYAPNDVAPYLAASTYFNEPYEFIGESPTTAPYWSSYCLSPAALFHPAVMDRADPVLCAMLPCMADDGFETPSISQALYPSLKTQMIEHNWVQNPPAPCNPGFGGDGTYDGCEPYYFNHGLASTPATLFYDGSVRLLPNAEAVAADRMVTRTTGDGKGLWFSPGDEGFTESANLTTQGYFVPQSYDKVEIGYHILTIDGILGRDTLGR